MEKTIQISFFHMKTIVKYGRILNYIYPLIQIQSELYDINEIRVLNRSGK